jgi:biotin transport system substrate-specific component
MPNAFIKTKEETTMYATRLSFDRANIVLRDALLVSFFVALTALGAQFAIRLPLSPVPITLQVLMVLLSGLALGRRRGFSSQLGYLTAGALGLPVFAGGTGGVGVLLGPTGGYLLAFPVAAFAAGMVSERLRWFQGPSALLASFLAVAVIYAGGGLWLAAWLYGTGSPSVGSALAGSWRLGVKPFILFDLVKAGLASATVLGSRFAMLRWFGEEI